MRGSVEMWCISGIHCVCSIPGQVAIPGKQAYMIIAHLGYSVVIFRYPDISARHVMGLSSVAYTHYVIHTPHQVPMAAT